MTKVKEYLKGINRPTTQKCTACKSGIMNLDVAYISGRPQAMYFCNTCTRCKGA